jgi:HEAT repeat protein
MGSTMTVADPSIDELVKSALASNDDGDEPTAATKALVRLQEIGSRDVLIVAARLCRSGADSERILGARLAGELGQPERRFPEECCDLLLEVLASEGSIDVRLAAIFALGHLGNRRCEPALVALRKHPDDRVRHAVAFALCGSESAPSVNALLELMDDPYHLARDWATTSIGGTFSLDGPIIREALLRRAADDDEMTRAEALHGLARRRDARVVPLLVRELSRHDARDHLFVDAAADYLGVGGSNTLGSEEIIARLKREMLRSI